MTTFNSNSNKAMQLVENLNSSVKKHLSGSAMVKALQKDDIRPFLLAGLQAFVIARALECMGSGRKGYDNSYALSVIIENSTDNEVGQIVRFLGNFISSGQELSLGNVLAAMRKAVCMTKPDKFTDTLNNYDKLSAILERDRTSINQAGGIEIIEAPKVKTKAKA